MRKERNEEAYQALKTSRKLPVEHPLSPTGDSAHSESVEEASFSSKYGLGSLAFFRGAMDLFSRPGMHNRLFLVLCAFALNNLSGASGL